MQVGVFLQVIGDTIGVEKSTQPRVVYNESRLLAANKAQLIKWPTDLAEINDSKSGFFRRRQIPSIIGRIDWTHVQILAGRSHENDFVNRKGFHSIHVQGVCSHKGAIICRF